MNTILYSMVSQESLSTQVPNWNSVSQFSSLTNRVINTIVFHTETVLGVLVDVNYILYMLH